jgi:hypothetical protein
MSPSRFPFLDEGEALRRLNIDRDTLLGLVQAGRLRAYSGFGKGSFFRQRDLDALYAELYGEAAEEGRGPGAEGPVPGRGKPFDPAYKVHVRLQADLKWYDLTDDDLRAWVREMHEDGYPRQRSNITSVIARLQRLIALMDEAAAGWHVLQAPPGPDPQPARRRPLQMLGGPPVPDAPAPDPPAAKPPMRGRPLPMAGAPPPRDPPAADE